LLKVNDFKLLSLKNNKQQLHNEIDLLDALPKFLFDWH